MEKKDQPENRTETQCVPEDFLAHLLHDLKAPIVTIGRTAKRILKNKIGPISPEQEKSLEIILEHCDRLEHDLEMILQHTRADLAERLFQESFDIGAMAKKRVQDMKPAAEEKNISLRFRAPSEAVPIKGDRFIIDKALYNLIDNAIKNTDDGGSVEVVLSASGDDIEIKVADNGRGIEKEHLDLVLRPFEEVMELRDREIRGFGLGLANVKRYAELHGGALEAKSTPDKGSVFTFRIPRSS